MNELPDEITVTTVTVTPAEGSEWRAYTKTFYDNEQWVSKKGASMAPYDFAKFLASKENEIDYKVTTYKKGDTRNIEIPKKETPEVLF